MTGSSGESYFGVMYGGWYAVTLLCFQLLSYVLTMASSMLLGFVPMSVV